MDYNYGQSNDYPLRILVPNDSVGAIIGKQGAAIKQIKQTTHAKVDVSKTESLNTPERVISIRGLQENCIKACREILGIMYEDAQKKNKTSEIVVKVLAHNNFIGRIIGKSGNIINAIKKETDTNITVSSLNDLNSYNIERVISIKGEFEQQLRAVENIYAKLSLAYENDNLQASNYSSSAYQYPQQQLVQQFTHQTAMLSGGGSGPPLVPLHYPPQHPSMMSPTSTTNSTHSTNKYLEQQAAHPSAIYTSPYYPPMFPISGQYYMPYPPTNQFIPSYTQPYGNGNGNLNHQQHSQSTAQLSSYAPATVETVHLYVPNAVIGAIIGTKGVFIKSIIRNSNASVKINPLNPQDEQNKNTDRQITITGTPEAQWKSQYYIYEKLRQDGYAGEDEVRLRAEIDVPTSLIGRIVGKGGQNVRQLQQSTGATIKLPEDSQETSASEVSVKIFGAFQASQFAQRRIQSVIQMSRDSSHGSNAESNNSEQSNNLIESTPLVNGNSSNDDDDAVVASASQQNSDDSTRSIDENQSSDK